MNNLWKYTVHGACVAANGIALGTLLEWTGRGAPESNSDSSQAFVILTLWIVLNLASAITALTALREPQHD